MLSLFTLVSVTKKSVHYDLLMPTSAETTLCSIQAVHDMSFVPLDMASPASKEKQSGNDDVIKNCTITLQAFVLEED